MNEHKYFETPAQVVYWDHDGEEWKSGIAYKDEIICGCCGGIIEISEIYEFAPAEIGCPIHAYKEWIDITDDIKGGEMPESMTEEEFYLDEEEEVQAEAWYFANLQDKAD